MTRARPAAWPKLSLLSPVRGYRASFSQRRARDKTDGSLQNPQVELAHLAGEVISSAVNDKLADIERSPVWILNVLPVRSSWHRGLCDLLQAKPTEMAALLEELTGTEITPDCRRPPISRPAPVMRNSATE